MIEITCRNDLTKLQGVDPAIASLVADELLPGFEQAAEDEGEELDPEVHGYITIIESMADIEVGDEDIAYWDGDEPYWEYIMGYPKAKAFVTETGTNRIVCVVFPDQKWLNGPVRRRIEEMLGRVA
ncbi:MAG: hypothetical protein HQL53_04185 [Magnetococcales bacterium]|nr:hypothetical protein [Magnetococcales bacterium]